MGKFLKILPAIVWDIQVAAELILTLFIVRLDILPDSYIIFLLGGGLLAVTVLTGFLLLKKPKEQKKDGLSKRQIIGMVIAIVIVVAGIAASFMAYRTRMALDAITVEEPAEDGTNEVLVTHMGVYVLSTDPAGSVASASVPFPSRTPLQLQDRYASPPAASDKLLLHTPPCAKPSSAPLWSGFPAYIAF